MSERVITYVTCSVCDHREYGDCNYGGEARKKLIDHFAAKHCVVATNVGPDGDTIILVPPGKRTPAPGLEVDGLMCASCDLALVRPATIDQPDPTVCYAFCRKCAASSRAATAEAEAKLEQFLAILRFSQPYPLTEVLRILADGVDHLEEAHDCDGDGWENRRRCRDAARGILADLKNIKL